MDEMRRADLTARQQALLEDRSPPKSREERATAELERLRDDEAPLTQAINSTRDALLKAGRPTAARVETELWERAQTLTDEALGQLEAVRQTLSEAARLRGEASWWSVLGAHKDPGGYSDRGASGTIASGLRRLHMDIIEDARDFERRRWERLHQGDDETKQDAPAGSVSAGRLKRAS
jgi:hypothetical protein